MLEIIEQRIKDLHKQLEQSIANHNALLGAHQELKSIYDAAKAAVEIIDPALTPVIEAVDAVVSEM